MTKSDSPMSVYDGSVHVQDSNMASFQPVLLEMNKTEVTSNGAHQAKPSQQDDDNISEWSCETTNQRDKTLLPDGSIAKVRNVYEGQPDVMGNVSWTAKYPDDLEEPPENAESAQYALLIRNKKCYDGRKMLQIDSLVVQSKLLKEVLAGVLEGYPGVSMELNRVEFKAPFAPFVHRWEKLVEAREKESDAETRDHVELLWQVLQVGLKEAIREKNDHVAHGVVRFDNIWTIFEPGKSVFLTDGNGSDRIYKLKSGDFESDCSGQKSYALKCDFVDWDGVKFGYGMEVLNIQSFNGTLPISKLVAYPLDCHAEKDSVEKALLARGRAFEALKGYHFQAYDGVAVGQGCWGPVRYNVKSRVVIDTHAFYRFNPNLKITLQSLDRVEESKAIDFRKGFRNGVPRMMLGMPPQIPSLPRMHNNFGTGHFQGTPKALMNDTSQTPLTEEQLLLCTNELRGYSLKDKKWLRFDISLIKDIIWNEEAFESLVVPAEQKRLILAFAKSQVKNKNDFDDVIQGKGRGIIMLLSGPPGVGKTLTAESVAETMKVPLYSMSAGDLGLSSHEVENSLGNILEMNTKWNSVLLLDEADVFLEARSPNDLDRNKQVSIFLRLLEYYEGILFLTTNRIENIDPAFESRIHLSLQYEELDKSSRRHVWEAFLRRTTKTDVFSDEQLDGLAEFNLNGRQIKNVLKTAQLLASEQGDNLTFSQINTVLKIRLANSRT